MSRAKKFAKGAILFAFAALFVFLLFVPLPQTVGAAAEEEDVVWQDGTRETLSYSEAFSMLAGAEGGDVLLESEGRTGRVAQGEAFAAVNAALSDGELAMLLIVGSSSFSRLGRAALFLEHGSTVYYAGEAFRYTGSRVERSASEAARRVVLSDGSLPAGYLASVGASELVLTAAAEFSAADLVGSRVTSARAVLPYLAEGEAVYLRTAGGTRLLAALPLLTSLEVAPCAYADRGALVPCGSLVSLTLPFAGSALHFGSETEGMFAWLFLTKSYDVPETLKSVKITGGSLIAHCFYACPDIEEIDVCGLDPAQISPLAFRDALGLLTLHTPRADVVLPAEGFESHIAPCGCTVYTRRGKS